MATNTAEFPSTDDFEALLAEFDVGTSTEVRENEITQGRVIEVRGDYVLIDIGFKSEGRVSIDEFKDPFGKILVNEGDQVDVLVETREDDTGRCVLSKEKADRMRVWEEIEKKYDADELVPQKIEDPTPTLNLSMVKHVFHIEADGISYVVTLDGTKVTAKRI